jgi:hypothetical protein
VITGTQNGAAHIYAGGISGGESGDYITDCGSTGNITITASTTSAGKAVLVGGIASGNSKVSRSYSTGNISGTSAKGFTYAGGIVSRDGIVESSFVTGDIFAKSASNGGCTLAGGISGFSTVVSNSYVTGSVEAVTTTSASNSVVGGIVAWVQNGKTLSIKNCYYAGREGSRLNHKMEVGYGSQLYNVGGILGVQDTAVSTGTNGIHNCAVINAALSFEGLTNDQGYGYIIGRAKNARGVYVSPNSGWFASTLAANCHGNATEGSGNWAMGGVEITDIAAWFTDEDNGFTAENGWKSGAGDYPVLDWE